MSKEEKDDFLSNDLIERMVRIEQRISAHFNKPIEYRDTEYYKSLKKSQRDRFEEYLKKKKNKEACIIAIISCAYYPVFI